MQRAEMEELRQREANMTALQAIGIRKKPKLDLAGTTGSYNQVNSSFELHQKYLMLTVHIVVLGAFTTACKARKSSGSTVPVKRRERNYKIPSIV
jgi:hypothetical protein